MFESTTEAFGVTAVETRHEPEAPEDNGSILNDDDLDFVGYTIPQLQEMAREDVLMGRKALYPRSEHYMVKYDAMCSKGKFGDYVKRGIYTSVADFQYWSERVIADERDLW